MHLVPGSESDADHDAGVKSGSACDGEKFFADGREKR